MATFEVLINDELMSSLEPSFESRGNEKVLSLLNDFEDRQWRFEKFQNFIWDNIIEAALSHEEREKLAGQYQSSLKEAAKNLRFTSRGEDVGAGSELAEILLYGVMRHHYNGLPVVPKIFYKQNSQDNAKGVDSVHIVLEGEDDFSIWFGEAKFYKELSPAMGAAIASIKETLGTEKLKRENRLITGARDMDRLMGNKEALLKRIRSLLDNQESIDDFKPRLHIPILLLHECKITKNREMMSSQYRNDIKKFHISEASKYFSKQIRELGSVSRYADIKFHLILFPIPDKERIVKDFVSNVNFYRGR